MNRATDIGVRELGGGWIGTVRGTGAEFWWGGSWFAMVTEIAPTHEQAREAAVRWTQRTDPSRVPGKNGWYAWQLTGRADALRSVYWISAVDERPEPVPLEPVAAPHAHATPSAV